MLNKKVGVQVIFEKAEKRKKEGCSVKGEDIESSYCAA